MMKGRKEFLELYRFLQARINNRNWSQLGIDGKEVAFIRLVNIQGVVYQIKCSHGYFAIDIFVDTISDAILKFYDEPKNNLIRIYKQTACEEKLLLLEALDRENRKINTLMKEFDSAKFYVVSNQLTNTPSEPIPLYWWDGMYNFGDWVGPWLVSKLSGRAVQNVRGKGAEKALYGVGSVLQMISPNHKQVSVWGSGLMNDDLSKFQSGTQNTKNLIRISAVRGQYTYNALTHAGIDVDNTFGDPAILMPKYYSPKLINQTKISIVPHFKHYALFKADVANVFDILDVRADLTEVINQIVNSKICLSTSLHGVIIAQSYGIPWVWLDITDMHMHSGDGFKFYDYFSILENPEKIERVKVSKNDLTVENLHKIARKAIVLNNSKRLFSLEKLEDALFMTVDKMKLD